MNSNEDLSSSELWSFLISYFGDYWEGKTEEDIVAGAAKENSDHYLLQIMRLIEEFVGTRMRKGEKRAFLLSANVYKETDEEAIDWLNYVKMLIDREINCM